MSVVLLTRAPFCVVLFIYLLLLLFFTLGIYSRGGLKIDENKLKGYDAQSVQSGTGIIILSYIL